MLNPQENVVDRSDLKKVLIAASIGNFVEWFDFGTYGFLATILATRFFPGGSPTFALMKTFAVFAVAFAFRPFGGIIFGMMGDRVGRKRTLALTILLMAFSTTVIGLLPSFGQIGPLAPILLVLARCVQGFSAGGEYAGACTYVMEHAPYNQRGRFGSFMPASTFGSFAVAAIVTYALSSELSPVAMQSWGWRVPFLAAAPVGLIGLYLRLNLGETPSFMTIQDRHLKTTAPLTETLTKQWRPMLLLGAFISFTALSFYTFTTYLSTYMQVDGHLDRSQSLLVTVISLLFASVFSPLVGFYTDAVGRRKTMLTAGVIMIVMIYPSLTLVRSGYLGLSIIGALLMALGAMVANVVTAPLLSEVFPTRTRYTASAVSYNLAYTIFGGTAPLVATFLISYTGSDLSPAFYIVVVAALGILGGMMLPETSRIVLESKDGSVSSLEAQESPHFP